MTGNTLSISFLWVDYKEEQAMEMEAMEAVFMDDFECMSFLTFVRL